VSTPSPGAARIHRLAPDIANKIAAGEVIERPSNAVKELVENALDAGARRIQIEIEEGGKKLIRIRDDGSGMSAGDAVLSLQRHATSKLQSENDLWNIATLGFRGEALPSIAAVSRVEITTRELHSEIGTRVIVEAGNVLDVSEIGCAAGTEITVRNLFFNTPARFKFLKSDSAEAARVNEMISHLALAFPHVAFSLSHNGNESLRVEAGGDPFNALVCVLGRETARQMLPLCPPSESETSNIRVTGFASRPQLTRANRNGQIFFVNKRAIKNRAIQHAVQAAYEGLLHGHSRYPMAVLFIELPPNAVDVNVHPTKSEVRFARENEIHHAARVAIRDTMVAAKLTPEWSFGEARSAGHEARSENYFPHGGAGAGSTPGTGTAFNPQMQNSQSPWSRPVAPSGGDLENFRAAYQSRISAPPFQPAPVAPSDQTSFPIHEENEPRLRLRPLGQIQNNAYILCEAEDGLYIVSQHRAHERILADKTIAETQNRPVEAQRLVIPLTVEVGPRALAALEENAALIKTLGFEVEAFGGASVLVRAVPALVAHRDYEVAFSDLLEELIGGHAGRDLEERKRKLLTMMACKNAIKAGDPLSPEHIQGLLDDLLRVENPSICPHGQPILIKISSWELNKKFEREYASR
jgi:DNA mismatch repair protein MutL